jgi:hypothetical protein
VASVEFHDAASKLSTTLRSVSGSLPAGKVSLRDLLELIGEQGMLLVCVFLTLPFLLPVSIPGVSTVFGLAIILIGVGVTLNRVPWLPRRILDWPLSTAPIKEAFDKGARFVTRFERMVRPRWLFLTRTVAGNIGAVRTDIPHVQARVVVTGVDHLTSTPGNVLEELRRRERRADDHPDEDHTPPTAAL